MGSEVFGKKIIVLLGLSFRVVPKLPGEKIIIGLDGDIYLSSWSTFRPSLKLLEISYLHWFYHINCGSSGFGVGDGTGFRGKIFR